MKRRSHFAALALAGAAFALPVSAAEEHSILAPDDVQWSPAPPSLPAGAEAAILYGDPSKEGLFAMRLKFPAGYQIPPHSHPKDEVVTVISGAFRIGMGDTADPSQAEALPAGGLFAFPARMTHFAAADEETIVQLNSTGPWGITYVDPADDPRQKTQ